jgi:hypothetical protein
MVGFVVTSSTVELGPASPLRSWLVIGFHRRRRDPAWAEPGHRYDLRRQHLCDRRDRMTAGAG